MLGLFIPPKASRVLQLCHVPSPTYTCVHMIGRGPHVNIYIVLGRSGRPRSIAIARGEDVGGSPTSPAFV